MYTDFTFKYIVNWTLTAQEPIQILTSKVEYRTGRIKYL